jgi:hypothetical protein
MPARPQPILRRGLATDALYMVVNIGLRVAFTGSIALAIEEIGRGLLPAGAIAVLRDDLLWLQAIAVIVVLDFFYWMHRAKHRYDWWWRLHETHHSSCDRLVFERPLPPSREDPRPCNLPRTAALPRGLRRGAADPRSATPTSACASAHSSTSS